MKEEFPRIKSLEEGIEKLFPYLTESQRRRLEEGFTKALMEFVGKEWGEGKISEERIRKEIKDKMENIIDEMERNKEISKEEKESLKNRLDRFIELIPAEDLVRYTGKKMHDAFKKDKLIISAKIAFKEVLKKRELPVEEIIEDIKKILKKKGLSEEEIAKKIANIMREEMFSEEEIKKILEKEKFSNNVTAGAIAETQEKKEEGKKKSEGEKKEEEEIRREWESLEERMDKAADFSIRGVDALKHIIVENMNRMIRKDPSMYISSLLGNPLRELYYRVRRGEEI